MLTKNIIQDQPRKIECINSECENSHKHN